MSRNTAFAALILAGLALAPTASWARGLGVEIWTDRGRDAVYKPGDVMQVKVRTSEDAYLLVYEIDTEGYVHVLYPYHGATGFVEGRRTMRVPDEDAQVELVVEKSTGEAYLVAVASDAPFGEMPWYLREYDLRSEGVDYVGRPDDEEGVTAEGRVVGDPFVAMERIRRRVLREAGDAESFATAYTSYYVHQRVRYPRYLCYDCHRPNHWAWWDGFDPYYATCSVVDFRINWGWYWGPSYWFGTVPYFVYVPRPDCPPHWRSRWDNPWYSSWDGWGRWNNLWGGPLVRYKSPPPPGYRPPSKYDDPTRWRTGGNTPPGILVTRGENVRHRPLVPVGRDDTTPGRTVRDGTRGRTATPNREPVREVRPGDDRARTERGRDVRRTPADTPREERGSDRPAREVRRSPADTPREERGNARPAREPSSEARAPRETPRYERPSPPPQQQQPREERRESPRQDDSPRYERPSPPPQQQQPREERRESPRQDDSPRYERPSQPAPPPPAPRESRPDPGNGGNGHGNGRGRSGR